MDLCAQIREFAQSDLTMSLLERDAENTFLDSNWQAIAAQGILGLCFPKQYGGSEQSFLTTILALQELGYGCPDNGLTLAVNGQMWAVQEPINAFGTEEQKSKYLTALIGGQCKGAHAMTEAGSGSNAFDLQTSATKTAQGYVLSGEKVLVGLAPVADLALTFARTTPGNGRWGLSAFLVDTNLPGVELKRADEKMGLRTSPLGRIVFEDVLVPTSCLLGSEGAGAAIFDCSMDFERSFIFTSHVGSMARQLDEVVGFAQKRSVGDHPISKHQAISNRVSDMRVRLETCRLFLRQSAEQLDRGERIPMQAAMAKLVISEALVENSLSAFRVMGGQGYLKGANVERDLRDFVGGVIYSGTSDIQRNLIAGLLGL